MKKITYLAPLMALPVLLLAGCRGATPAVGLSANWNKDTMHSSLDAPKEIESLTYAVTFEGADRDAYAVHYGEGVYTTRLECRMLDLGEGEQQYGYYYRTRLDLPVWFTINGQESEHFDDYVESEVWFMNFDNALQPVKSVKTASSYTPLGSTPASFESDYYVHYADNLTVEYNRALSEATLNRTFTERTSSSETAEEKKIENQKTAITKENFFDNEQLLLMLRAVDLSSAQTFNTIDTSSNKTQSQLRTTAATAAPFAASFTLTEGDAEPRTVQADIDAVTTQMSYSKGMSGQAQSLVFAAKTSNENNVYRNFLLQMETPLDFSLGTLKYTLKSATVL